MKKTSIFASVLLLSSHQASAADDFKVCLDNIATRALAEGVSEQTIETSFANIRQITRVKKLDKSQPEFSQTFADYFYKRVTPWRVSQGRKLYQEHKTLLKKLHTKYGVPPQYLLAFWGLETNFGSYKGKMPVLSSLATLACDPRRAEFFTKEMILALKLKQKNKLTDAKMVGSWAGAMGHTQFMPSAYYQYAVDGDGDGIVDLWDSTEDALSSAANFLSELGWQRNERWGREVRLPASYDYQYLGKKDTLALTRWAQLGVTKANGNKLATPDMDAALYLPSGATGPAFIGYQNFDVIMRWNRSIFYAISVGHLADRINGAAPLIQKAPKLPQLKRAQIKALQQKLSELGYGTGKPDGIWGAKSQSALQEFQRAKGMLADGFPSKETFVAMGISD